MDPIPAGCLNEQRAGHSQLAGYVAYTVILGAAFVTVRAQTGVVLDAWTIEPVHLWAPIALVGLGALAGIIPALKAYRTDVATNLNPLS